MWNPENKDKNIIKEGINQYNKNTEKENKSNNDLLDNYLYKQKYEQCSDFQNNENSQEENDTEIFLNKKRTRNDKHNSKDQNNFSFNNDNNPQNIVEENRKVIEDNLKNQEIGKKVATETDKKIQKNYIINNMNKQDLRKAIKVMQIPTNQKEDIKKIEPFYADYSTTLKKKIIKIEEKLEEDTYLKTQYIKNEPNLYPNKNIYLNLQNPITINDFNDYSFKCLSTNLNFSIYKGTNELKFKLKLENNGSFPWPKNKTILSTDKSKSNIKIKEIILDPLNPGISCDFDALFRNMSQLSEGKYYSNLEFKVCGKKYGNNILINVEILEDKKKKYEPVINVVRDEYLLDKNTASDTIIAEGIDKTKTIEGAFNYIVEKNSKNKNK